MVSNLNISLDFSSTIENRFSDEIISATIIHSTSTLDFNNTRIFFI